MTTDLERLARVLQDRDKEFSPDEPIDPAYVDDVRAILTALREPTLQHREFLEGKTGCGFIEGWRAMIDHILEGK